MVPTSVWIAINSFNELIQRRDRSHASKIPLTKYIQSWEFRSTHSDFTKIQAPWKWNKSQMKQLINSNKRNIQTYFLSKWQHCHHHYHYDQMSRNHEKTAIMIMVFFIIITWCTDHIEYNHNDYVHPSNDLLIIIITGVIISLPSLPRVSAEQ